MKSYTSTNVFIFAIFVLFSAASCSDEEIEQVLAPMEQTEQEALYSAVQGFVGKLWNGSDLYPDPCGWTPIQGVSCDLFNGLWYVTVLNIGPVHDNSLSCSPNAKFRPQLFDLKRLKTLSFSNCFMSPHDHPIQIPTENWWKLSESLESLQFRSNPGLTGKIPSSFGGLKKLQSLVLVENGLHGGLPSNIGDLVQLQRLVLSGNWFTGSIPASFGRLNQLLIFDLSQNSLSGPLPNTFGSLTSLLKLDLSNNHLGGSISQVGDLKNLTLLDLRSNNFSGGLTKSMQEMHALEEMALSNNPIGGDLNTLEWQNMDKLVILDLSKTGLTGEIPESISELKRLRFLGLSDNKLRGDLSPKLATLPCISALYLHGNNLTGKLEFSESFYAKMGSRFGAWNNPNLCYPDALVTKSNVPFGVKPCQAEVTLLESNSITKLENAGLNQKFYFTTSLGFSNCGGIDGIWWLGGLLQLIIVLLLNWFI
ncbi:piriformospora indica-insensitive protein 2-like [Argentina anserina]|uniref:piriformospora indica-insensitive protein 2-like n=1 Tax=Argentina anserina TaxID=57926 RepID=UPI00217624E8|nr:piriformospora indica-insensitive protein 2-like [Potentilla anserina]